MIALFRVMQRACLCYYTIIMYHYVIITPGSIITHYYLFQSPELSDGGVLSLSSSEKMTPCQIPTYTGIFLDNLTCDLSQDIQV